MAGIILSGVQLGISPEQKPQPLRVIILFYEEKWPEVDGKALEELDKSDAEEFVAETQEEKEGTIEGIVRVLAPESFCLDPAL